MNRQRGEIGEGRYPLEHIRSDAGQPFQLEEGFPEGFVMNLVAGGAAVPPCAEYKFESPQSFRLGQ